jgi:uncharacterized Zn-binding protein involved in type VI secretion
MGQPAARVGDMHTCPMQTPGVPPIPHVGGPITGPGVLNVLIGKMPACVLGDMATCVGPPDAVVKGSAGVLIGGRPAARMGDTCAHGGAITVGCPTVLIGEVMPSPPPVVVVPPFPGSVVAKPSPAGQQAQAEKAQPAKAQPKKGVEKEKPVYQISFELVGEDGKGIPLEKYRVTLPDGSIREGMTGFNGGVTIGGIEVQGSCKISFPELDQDCWEEA